MERDIRQYFTREWEKLCLIVRQENQMRKRVLSQEKENVEKKQALENQSN